MLGYDFLCLVFVFLSKHLWGSGILVGVHVWLASPARGQALNFFLFISSFIFPQYFSAHLNWGSQAEGVGAPLEGGNRKGNGGGGDSRGELEKKKI